MPAMCPCGSNKSYEDCCEPYLTGQQTAATPEALMRSRYSAFAKRKFAYLAKTMKGEAAKVFDISAARSDAPLIQWLKLEVIRSEEQGDAGLVEFKAHFKYRNKSGILHEVSRFKKDDGAWFYIRGNIRNGQNELFNI